VDTAEKREKSQPLLWGVETQSSISKLAPETFYTIIVLYSYSGLDHLAYSKSELGSDIFYIYLLASNRDKPYN
jgi:hypothetical protein